jgi:hypothetical protein
MLSQHVHDGELLLVRDWASASLLLLHKWPDSRAVYLLIRTNELLQ